MKGMQSNHAEQEKLCNNCMLGICIISVKMLCFLFPGKESTEGRKPGATQCVTNSSSGVEPLHMVKVNTLPQTLHCVWMRMSEHQTTFLLSFFIVGII